MESAIFSHRLRFCDITTMGRGAIRINASRSARGRRRLINFWLEPREESHEESVEAHRTGRKCSFMPLLSAFRV